MYTLGDVVAIAKAKCPLAELASGERDARSIKPLRDSVTKFQKDPETKMHASFIQSYVELCETVYAIKCKERLQGMSFDTMISNLEKISPADAAAQLPWAPSACEHLILKYREEYLRESRFSDFAALMRPWAQGDYLFDPLHPCLGDINMTWPLKCVLFQESCI